ncbi:unnamed protein product [Pleuronectes platessa]|uniref:Uncharacterized protein n=1 Tax=Pleuronectes platessa TaxID=8262 RepID=A0A9N7TGB4_PLEPL|nr:unnamed protein product [Pleuronectes platessa]
MATIIQCEQGHVAAPCRHTVKYITEEEADARRRWRSPPTPPPTALCSPDKPVNCHRCPSRATCVRVQVQTVRCMCACAKIKQTSRGIVSIWEHFYDPASLCVNYPSPGTVSKFSPGLSRSPLRSPGCHTSSSPGAHLTPGTERLAKPRCHALDDHALCPPHRCQYCVLHRRWETTLAACPSSTSHRKPNEKWREIRRVTPESARRGLTLTPLGFWVKEFLRGERVASAPPPTTRKRTTRRTPPPPREGGDGGGAGGAAAVCVAAHRRMSVTERRHTRRFVFYVSRQQQQRHVKTNSDPFAPRRVK